MLAGWFARFRPLPGSQASSDARSRAAAAAAEPAASPAVTVGWVLDTDTAGFIWDAPRRVSRARPERRHAKSLTQCPAIADSDARLFEIRCPVDVELGFALGAGDKPQLVDLAGDQSPIRSKHLNQMVALLNRKEWVYPDRPVIQFVTPYVFVADEQVFASQLPPFNHYRREPMPGLMVPGRLPIYVWPRTLMWAFEWWDSSKPLVLRRGEPWWYVRFEATDPARPVRLIEAELTSELREYMNGLAGVTNYVNHTYQLFRTAQERRPPRLLVPKQRRPPASGTEPRPSAQDHPPANSDTP